DFLGAGAGCSARSVVAAVVDAVTAGANASSRVVCGELDRDAESCRLTGALIAGEGGETIVEGVVLGARGSGRNPALAREYARNRAGARGNGRNRAEALGNSRNHRLAIALVAGNLHNDAARACDRSAHERGRSGP